MTKRWAEKGRFPPLLPPSRLRIYWSREKFLENSSGPVFLEAVLGLRLAQDVSYSKIKDTFAAFLFFFALHQKYLKKHYSYRHPRTVAKQVAPKVQNTSKSMYPIVK